MEAVPSRSLLDASVLLPRVLLVALPELLEQRAPDLAVGAVI